VWAFREVTCRVQSAGGKNVTCREGGFRVADLGFWISVFGSRVSDLKFRISVFWSRVSDPEFWISGFGSRVSELWSRISGFGLWISGFGYRVRVPVLGFQVSPEERARQRDGRCSVFEGGISIPAEFSSVFAFSASCFACM